MQNLRDKLLKAGLVSAEQAAKAEKTEPTPERRRERPERPAPGSKPGGPMLVARLQPLSAVPKLPPLPGS